MKQGKKKFESLTAAFGEAAKFVAPVGAPAAGALVGGLGLRYLVAKTMPDDYATKEWVPYVAGGVGALAGGLVATYPFLNLKTKSGREKAYKAQLPLAGVGILAIFGLITLGPKAAAWFREKYPTANLALNPAPENAALLSAVASAPETTESGALVPDEVIPAPTASASFKPRLVRSGGLTPAQYERMHARAAGLVGNARRREDVPRFVD